MASDSDQGPSKRPRPEVKSSRRALSCTECKRRKTKCSALGKTPCDSCVKRGRPADCYWEDAPERPSYALASDVDALRMELRDLRTQVHSLSAPPSVLPGYSSNGGSSAQSPYVPAAPKPARRKDGIEVTVSTLEDTIVGVGPGSRPTKRSHAMPWDTAARRQALIDTAMNMLPHPATAAALLDEFFTGPVHLCWYVMDERTFRAKHAAFEAGELDPSWLALYLIVLAITTKISPNNATNFPGYSEADVELIPTALYQSSLNALEAAEYLAIPQVRHIQCAILYVVTLFHFGDDDDDVKRQNIVLRHLDAAVSTLLWLDLDIMSDDWTAAPLDDPALAGLSPHAAHELCKQLVHIVQFMDTTIPRRRSIWRLMNITTSIPANRKVPSDMDYPELPSHVVTPAGLPRSANAFCVALRKYGNDSVELTHEETMVYDAELRSALALVPPPASLDTSWMLHMVITSVHNRILRAHRPFLMRSVNDPSLEVSRRACVESARRIVEAQLVFNAKPKIRPRFAVRWVIGAVVVLAMDYVLGNMDSRTSLLQARDVFLSVIGPRGKHCVKALDALVYAADVKTGTVLADTDLGTFFDLVKEKLANTEAPQGAMNMLFPGLEEFDFEGMLSGDSHAV